MTALPKRKISTRRKGKRRSSHNLKLPQLVNCKHCGSKKIYRQICPNCQK
ncbi:MAG TPA: 50S ribosomal protein L32 [Candidatus Bathyarchaeia archaeon]|nr:50S ribosomal protein L32 [Candidatus Bathyarchaeia archaeon]